MTDGDDVMDVPEQWVTLELLCDGIPARGIDASLSIFERLGCEVDRERVKVKIVPSSGVVCPDTGRECGFASDCGGLGYCKRTGPNGVGEVERLRREVVALREEQHHREAEFKLLHDEFEACQEENDRLEREVVRLQQRITELEAGE